jgi:triacylglycerol lipase
LPTGSSENSGIYCTFLRFSKDSVMHRRVKLLVVIVACLSLLTACTGGMSPSQLQALGSSVTPVSINFEELSAYANRSNTAYASEAVIRSTYPATIRINAPGNTDARYFLEQDDKAKTQYITVRGTADSKNFSEDLNITIRTDRKTDIPVDSGFDSVAQAIYTDVKPFLKPGYKTYVTGHSLGGAVAALVAVYIIEDGGKVERVVTFGQPKFTTAAGVKRLGFLPITRVVDENDMVPMLPPRSFRNLTQGTYEHVGPEIILLEGPRYVYLPSHDANRLSVNELWRTMAFDDLPDHHMDNYLKRLSTKFKAAVEVAYNQREQYIAKVP